MDSASHSVTLEEPPVARVPHPRVLTPWGWLAIISMIAVTLGAVLGFTI